MLDERTAVDFIRMKDGTAEEYAFLQRQEAAFAAGTAERVLAGLRSLENSMGGYRVSRLGHSLQSAARAERDSADIDWIVSALLHDIGDALAPHNHSQLAAAIVEPFVREECSWVVRHHGAFQMIYYGHHIGLDPEARERYSRQHELQGLRRVLRTLGPGVLRPGLRHPAAGAFRTDGA